LVCKKLLLGNNSKYIYKARLYKVTERQFRKVKFKYFDIDIPRCPNCAEFHNKGEHVFLFVLFICIILGIIIGGLFFEKSSWIIGGIIGLPIGIIAGRLIMESKLKQWNIVGEGLWNSNLKDYDPIKYYLKIGWQLDEPRP